MFVIAYARFDNRHSITSLSMKTAAQTRCGRAAYPAPSASNSNLFNVHTHDADRGAREGGRRGRGGIDTVHSINPFLFDMLIP